MARNSLGSLVVTLGLNAAEFTSGLTKSEYEAKKFAEKIDKGIAAGAKAAAVALTAMGAAGAAAFAAINSAANRVGEFKDLEEITGASAESLASFAIAAGVAGTDMKTLADASVKLTKSLVGVDDESKAAGAALTALGLPIKDFKQLDPAAQMEAVAKALANFEDGAGKTAVAVALFGKAGAQLLPFLKELEQQGGRQVILTQQQIEMADAYADAQKRATEELKLYVDRALIQALPAITDVVKAMKEFVVQLTGVDKETAALAANNGVVTFAEQGARALAFLVDAGDGVVRVALAIGTAWGGAAAAGRALLSGEFARAKNIAAQVKQDIDDILTRQLFSDKLAKEQAARRQSDARRAVEDRGFRPPGRRLAFEGAEERKKEAKERETEAERYIKQLERQEEATLDLTVAEQALRDITAQRIKLTKGKEGDETAAIMNAAARVDAAKAIAKATEEARKAEEERQRAASERMTQSLREQDSIRAANEQLAQEIVLIGKDDETRRALTLAFEQENIQREINNRLKRQEAAGAGDYHDELQKEIDLLRERAVLLGRRDVAVKIAEDMQRATEQAREFNDAFGAAFASSLSDAASGVKSLKEAFADFGRSVLRIINDIAARNIAQALFGGTGTSNEGLLVGIGKTLAAAMFGAPAGGGGLNLSGYGPAFATGTQYAPGGWAMVGERGPELVNLPRGSKVYPHGQGPGRSVTVSINQSFSGNTSAATAGQIGARTAMALRRALERNG